MQLHQFRFRKSFFSLVFVAFPELELKKQIMIKNLRYYLTPLTILFFHFGFAQGESCQGFRTQTQGGWGQGAAGNNPGSFRDTHFDEAFPEGITLGCDFEIFFQTSESVENFLPSGGPARALTENLINPTNYGNVLAGQLLALTLSVGFDATYPYFSTPDVTLSELIVTSGEFEGFTVSEILDVGNEVLGGCSTDYSPGAVNEVLSSINENYVDGTIDNGFLDCPENAPECQLDLTGISTDCTDQDTYVLTVQLSGLNGSFEVVAENALSIEPSRICFPVENTSTEFVFIEFPGGSEYEFQLLPSQDELCESLGQNQCSLGSVTGVAPECCSLSIDCGEVGTETYSCLGEIPDTEDLVEITSESCGEVSLQVTETLQGQGCTNNPLILTRTFTVTNGTDQHSCTQTFTVIDSEAPVITCPPDQNTTCESSMTPTQFATASDNCDEEVEITYFNGAPQGCGFFVRTWIASDNCGNSSFCYQNVYIEDNSAPIISTPSNVTVECGANLDPFSIGFPEFSDDCSDVQLTYEDSEPGPDECTLSIVRTWIATDACGNSSSAEQLITVIDQSGPVIIGVQPSQVLQCEEIPVAPDVIAVDNCSGDTIILTKISASMVAEQLFCAFTRLLMIVVIPQR